MDEQLFTDLHHHSKLHAERLERETAISLVVLVPILLVASLGIFGVLSMAHPLAGLLVAAGFCVLCIRGLQDEFRYIESLRSPRIAVSTITNVSLVEVPNYSEHAGHYTETKVELKVRLESQHKLRPDGQVSAASGAVPQVFYTEPDRFSNIQVGQRLVAVLTSRGAHQEVILPC